MKRNFFVVMALAVLSALAGCNRGTPTLVPTIQIPPTETPGPTETFIPTETPIPIPTEIPTGTPIPRATVRRTATLRAGPGVDYDVAGTANFGTTLIVYARCEGWLMVSNDDTQWIIEGKVTLNVDLDAIQDICSAPPEPTATSDSNVIDHHLVMCEFMEPNCSVTPWMRVRLMQDELKEGARL